MKQLLIMSLLTLTSLSSKAQTIQENEINKTMTAKELMIEYLNNIQNPKKVAELFTEDGAIELPYFVSVNIPPRSVGKKQIIAFISDLLKQAPDYKFINIKILIETPEQVFAEYEVNTLFNGKQYKQLYMGRLVAKNGKIVLIREACDTVVIERLKD